MLSIDPSSYCDVCFGSFVDLPHSIDCGHIFCSTCLDAICEKTWSPRQQPACPFCRETFTRSSVRKIRIDLKTPRLPVKEIDDDDFGKDYIPEAKRLEEKVAKAAASKCSFEEVSELHKEIQQWLASEVKRRSTEQHASLELSAALLRAILLNCLAYSEASKVAKGVETSLKERLETTQMLKDRLDAELQKQRLQYSQKVRECQELRSELNRLKLTSIPGGIHARAASIGLPPHSASPSPLSRSTSVRSTTTPSLLHSQRPPYFQRPSSTGPIPIKNILTNSGMHVGSAPISNTFASAMKLHVSASNSRATPFQPDALQEDDKSHERWIPTSDDESAVSDTTKLSGNGSSSTARSLATSSSHSKWMPRFQLPPVDI